MLKGNDKRFIARGDRVMCLPMDADDKGIKEAIVAEVHDEKHVMLRFGPLGVLHRDRVPVEKLVRL